MNLRALELGDHVAARTLVEACGLPVDDLSDPRIELMGAFDSDELVAVIGLQACGPVGLLRSLAVRAEHRSRGIGSQLCVRALELANTRGLHPVYLLTTDAMEYFARRGFVSIDRLAAPPEIRATAQFTTLCSSSARVMVHA